MFLNATSERGLTEIKSLAAILRESDLVGLKSEWVCYSQPRGPRHGGTCFSGKLTLLARTKNMHSRSSLSSTTLRSKLRAANTATADMFTRAKRTGPDPAENAVTRTKRNATVNRARSPEAPRSTRKRKATGSLEDGVSTPHDAKPAANSNREKSQSQVAVAATTKAAPKRRKTQPCTSTVEEQDAAQKSVNYHRLSGCLEAIYSLIHTLSADVKAVHIHVQRSSRSMLNTVNSGTGTVSAASSNERVLAKLEQLTASVEEVKQNAHWHQRYLMERIEDLQSNLIDALHPSVSNHVTVNQYLPGSVAPKVTHSVNETGQSVVQMFNTM